MVQALESNKQSLQFELEELRRNQRGNSPLMQDVASNSEKPTPFLQQEDKSSSSLSSTPKLAMEAIGSFSISLAEEKSDSLTSSESDSESVEVSSQKPIVVLERKVLSMMKAMGYQEGQGLGTNGQGRLLPITIQERSKNLGLGCDLMKCDYCGKLGHIANQCWSMHPKLLPKRLHDKEGKKLQSTSNNDSDSDFFYQNKVIETVERIYPCTFCSSSWHCVEQCWKHKVYSKKIGATKSQPSEDDKTLQVKKQLGKISLQSAKEAPNSKNSTSTKEKVCQKRKLSGHVKGNCPILPSETASTPTAQDVSKSLAREQSNAKWNWANFMPYAL